MGQKDWHSSELVVLYKGEVRARGGHWRPNLLVGLGLGSNVRLVGTRDQIELELWEETRYRTN